MDSKKKLIIDTDCGVDDAIALVAALSPRLGAEVVAITCVAGNTSLENVVKNVAKVLKVCEREDIPIYAGCDAPLVRENVFGSHYHGEDGLGECPEEHKGTRLPESNYHATQALIDISGRQPGEIILILLGPCTNLAAAHQIDPKVTSYFKEIVSMGGNIEGRGNVTPGAEFNFASDPEAAHIFIHQSRCPVTLVPWETITKNYIPWEAYEAFTDASISEKSRFLKAICKFTEKYYRNETIFHTGYELGDFLAVLAVIEPKSVVKKMERRLAVELRGEYTAGQVVQAWHNDMLPHVTKNTNVVLDFDKALIEHVLGEMVKKDTS